MFSLFKLKRGIPTGDLAVEMAGVRMRERLLHVGLGDPAVFAASAAKVGLTGNACAVVGAPADAAALEHAAAEAGVLVEVTTAPAGNWPYEGASFDVAIVDGNLVRTLDDSSRSALLADVRRVVRAGGRILVVFRSRRGMASRLGFERSAAHQDIGESLARSMAAAGFNPVRFLASREGMTFVEAFRPQG